jgi:chromosome segregation ATPase
MWDTDKQQRLDELQRRAQQAPLAADEQQVLDRLVLELEQAEWAALRPALSQLRREQEDLQADLSQVHTQNAVVAALVERYGDLLARAKVQLDALARERAALQTEYERVLQNVGRP